MSYPPFEEYQEALRQPPHELFADPLLAAGHVTRLQSGEPLARSGNFALTYQVVTPHRAYAVRCFHKECDTLQQRYHAIRRRLERSPQPFFVDFEFQPDGIRTESGSYPILRMDWVEGDTLGAYIADRHRDTVAMQQLRATLRIMARQLTGLGIAHGDIQPANMIVKDATDVRLVDYDGMYVPELAPLGSIEIGQRNFQHPGRRSRHYDNRLDSFSFAVIDLALGALVYRPELWEATSSDESALLLRGEDYANPWSSLPFGRLREISALDLRTRQLAAVCQSPFEEIPDIEDFLAGRNIPMPRLRTSGATYSTQRPMYLPAYPVVDAANVAQCCTRIGDRVEIIGQVRRAHDMGSSAASGTPARIEFGVFPDDMAVLQAHRGLAGERNAVFDGLRPGDWVSAIGLVEPPRVERVNSQSCKMVSIQITHRSQVTRLSAGEALHRLNASVRSGRPQLDAATGKVGTDPAVPELPQEPDPNHSADVLDLDLPDLADASLLTVDIDAGAAANANADADGNGDAVVTEFAPAVPTVEPIPPLLDATPVAADVEPVIVHPALPQAPMYESPAAPVTTPQAKLSRPRPPPVKTVRNATAPRPKVTSWWLWIAAGVAVLVLASVFSGKESTGPASSESTAAATRTARDSDQSGDTGIAGHDGRESGEVDAATDLRADAASTQRAAAPARPGASTVRSRSLVSASLPIATRAGLLTIVRRNNSVVLRLDAEELGESRAREISLAQQAFYPDREVISGFSGCSGSAAGCRGRMPFWLVLHDNGRAEYRQLDTVASGDENADVTALASSVHVDLGVLDGVRRTAMLTYLGDPYLATAREPRRRLSHAECSEVEQALESCAAARNCRSIDTIERELPRSRVEILGGLFHETTGLDAEGFRRVCVRSCQLGLTPSRSYRNDRSAAAPGPGSGERRFSGIDPDRNGRYA